ncbi:hypothetical protein G9A89_017538 [Geosiphon pyriformis]|nr:hypothetical protein G9A89_017538 [Geosiphon pyriformis]
MTELLPLQDEDFTKAKRNGPDSSHATGAVTQRQAQNPQGVFLGQDGKPCRPCTAFKDWTRKGKKSAHESSAVPRTSSNTSSNSSPESSLTNLEDCPPDSEQLGRSTWTFLHTMAAYYPDLPSTTQKQTMTTFLRTFSNVYPCWYCAEHLRSEMQRSPPNVENRHALSRWLCNIHNEVNLRLGKKVFDCEKTDERWKDGPPDGRL